MDNSEYAILFTDDALKTQKFYPVMETGYNGQKMSINKMIKYYESCNYHSTIEKPSKTITYGQDVSQPVFNINTDLTPAQGVSGCSVDTC